MELSRKKRVELLNKLESIGTNFVTLADPSNYPEHHKQHAERYGCQLEAVKMAYKTIQTCATVAEARVVIATLKDSIPRGIERNLIERMLEIINLP